MAESPSGESTGVEAEHGPPVTKKSKRQCHFDPKWSKELKLSCIKPTSKVRGLSIEPCSSTVCID